MRGEKRKAETEREVANGAATDKETRAETLSFFLNFAQVIAFDPDTSHLDELAGYGLAVAGLYCQVGSWK